MQHAGYWERWKGGAVHKGPDDADPNTDRVIWCPGSGRLPSPDPDNMIDPWSAT